MCRQARRSLRLQEMGGWSSAKMVRRYAYLAADHLSPYAEKLCRPLTPVTESGKPIVQVSTKAWYAALERAEIEDFRWHDLRHTWASWHVQNGTPLFALQELGGWESPEMVRRYAHLAADHLAPFAERLCALRAVIPEIHGTNSSQA